MANRPKRRLRNFLLDAHVQLRYAGWVLAACALVGAGLGWLVYAQSRLATSQLEAALASPELAWLDAGVRAEVLSTLTASDVELVLGMVGVGAWLAVVLAAALVVMTHRVAGPLFRLRRLLDELGRGRMAGIGSLRRGDQFRDLFEVLRATQEALARREQQSLAAFSAALRGLEARQAELSPQVAEVVGKLRARCEESAGAVGVIKD